MKPANGFRSIFGAIRAFNDDSPTPGAAALRALRLRVELYDGEAESGIGRQARGRSAAYRSMPISSSASTPSVLGSTVALAGGASIQTQYGYDPYGVAQTTGAASANAYRFTGRENDQELLRIIEKYAELRWNCGDSLLNPQMNADT